MTAFTIKAEATAHPVLSPTQAKHSLFLKIPVELRVEVYSYLLPQNLTLQINRSSKHPETDKWIITHPAKALPGEWLSLFWHGPRHTRRVAWNESASLLRTCKLIYAEARACLYNNNTFLLKLSVHNPTIFLSSTLGPFSHPHRLHLLHLMNRVMLHVHYLECFRTQTKRVREVFRNFTRVVEAQDVPLRYLDVSMSDAAGGSKSCLAMFALEDLAGLRAIACVEVWGVEEWFGKCVRMCLMGEAEWPLVKEKRTKDGRNDAYREVWIRPVLDWVQFAERHGIEMPRLNDDYFRVPERDVYDYRK